MLSTHLNTFFIYLIYVLSDVALNFRHVMDQISNEATIFALFEDPLTPVEDTIALLIAITEHFIKNSIVLSHGVCQSIVIPEKYGHLLFIFVFCVIIILYICLALPLLGLDVFSLMILYNLVFNVLLMVLVNFDKIIDKSSVLHIVWRASTHLLL